MEMKLRIESKLGTALELEAAVTPEAVRAVVEGFLNASGVAEQTAAFQNVVRPQAKVTPQSPLPVRGMKVKVQPVETKTKSDAPKVVKVTPKIGEERTLTSPIGEKLAAVMQPIKNKEVAKSSKATNNIRVTPEGKKLYRAAYWCMCGHEGNRYTPKDNAYVKCHECDMKLRVESAVPGEQLLADKSGSFFVAREVFTFEER